MRIFFLMSMVVFLWGGERTYGIQAPKTDAFANTQDLSRKEKTLIFIHGGMQGGWCWDRVTPFFKDEMLQVLTPSLSGLGSQAHLHGPTINLSTHIHDIVDIIDKNSLQNVVLIGHSYGGMVATGVAALRPKSVKLIIYLDAVLAEPGQSLSTALPPETWAFLLKRAEESGQGWQVPALAPEDYGFQKESDKNFVRNRSTPQSLASFTEPLYYGLSVHHKIPAVYVRCLKSPFLHNMEERARKMGIPCQTINTGHVPMVDSPELLSSHLLALIKGTHG